MEIGNDTNCHFSKFILQRREQIFLKNKTSREQIISLEAQNKGNFKEHNSCEWIKRERLKSHIHVLAHVFMRRED